MVMATMTPQSSSSSSSAATSSSLSPSSPSSSSPHRANTWIDEKLSQNILFTWTEVNSFRLYWCLWKVLVLVVPNNTTPSPPPNTGTATFLSPLYDRKIGRVAVEGTSEAENLPRSFKCGAYDVQTSPWTPFGSPWNFGHVQNSRSKQSPRRSLKGGRYKAHTSPRSQNGCTVVGHWSPYTKWVLL